MQLVEKGVHAKTGHTGGDNVFKNAAAIVSALATGIAEAKPADWAEFGLNTLLPIGADINEAGAGSAFSGPGTPFPTYQDYADFSQRLKEAESRGFSSERKGK